jgi:glycosyltransferase involved in cell wall biosynthesis
MPFFSVIIPVYNKEKFVENTLKSVLNQTFSDFEIIIVNDGSTDQSENIVLEFQDPRIRYYTQKNQGVSVARNHGIRLAQSKYITFIDADDFWYSEFLNTMYQTIHRFPKQKVFACAIEIETSKTIFPASYSIKKTGDVEIVNYFEASLKESVIWTSSVVLHKNVFSKTGFFDAEVKIAEDTDLWIRVGLHYPVVLVWKILARYVYDAKSVSRQDQYIFEASSFLKYADEEIKNKALKKFLDYNRFSVAVKSKLTGDFKNFNLFFIAIDLKILPLKKRVLLYLPGFVLKRLVTFKTVLANMGLGNSVFK